MLVTDGAAVWASCNLVASVFVGVFVTFILDRLAMSEN